MREELYTLAATGVKYILAAILGIILIRIVYIQVLAWREQRYYADKQDSLGYLEYPNSSRIQIGIDNIIGFSRRCDIVIRDPSLLAFHAQLYLRHKKVFLQPLPGHPVISVNGEQIHKRIQVFDSDKIVFGEIALKLILY